MTLIEPAGPVAPDVDGPTGPDRAFGDAASRRRPRVGWVLVVGGCLLAISALYVFAVRTELGQRLDNAAVLRHHLDRTPEGDVSMSSRILKLAAVSLIPVVVWFGRKDRRQIVTSGCAVAVSLLLAEGLRETLPRPELGIFDPSYGASYPSGHAAAAMALALAAVVALRDRPRLRSVVFVVPAFVAATAIATPIHRPSDLAAGFAIAFACMTAAHWSRRRPAAADDAVASPARHRPWFGPLVGIVGLTAGLLAAETLALRRAHLSLPDLGAAFPVALLGLVALAAGAVGAFHLVLRLR